MATKVLQGRRHKLFRVLLGSLVLGLIFAGLYLNRYELIGSAITVLAVMAAFELGRADYGARRAERKENLLDMLALELRTARDNIARVFSQKDVYTLCHQAQAQVPTYALRTHLADLPNLGQEICAPMYNAFIRCEAFHDKAGAFIARFPSYTNDRRKAGFSYQIKVITGICHKTRDAIMEAMETYPKGRQMLAEGKQEVPDLIVHLPSIEGTSDDSAAAQ